MSSNRAAAQLMRTVGIASTIDYARRFGITSPLAPVPSLAIGTGEVTLLELTSAYSAFANSGAVAEPVLLRRVEDRTGKVLWQTRVSTHRAVSNETAFLISSMLGDVVQRGTASVARTLGFKLPAAGKTGTTDDFRDVWFVGYTPHLVAGVWFGFDAADEDHERGIRCNGGGSRVGDVHEAARRPNSKPDWFKAPAGVRRVTLCRLSGQLATDECTAAGRGLRRIRRHRDGQALHSSCAAGARHALLIRPPHFPNIFLVEFS